MRRARQLFCVFAAVSLLGHGAHLLAVSEVSQAAGDRPGAPNAAPRAQSHPWLCRLL